MGHSFNKIKYGDAETSSACNKQGLPKTPVVLI
jgi:hypothetical protein